MLIKYTHLIVLSFILLSGCSILDNDTVLIIDKENINQKWMYLSTDKDFILRSYDRDKANDAEYHIIYDFRETASSKCNIIHSEKRTGYYQNCGWTIQGNSPDLFFRLYYGIEGANNSYQRFSYFYEIQELSKDRFRLKMLREVVLH